MTFLRHLRAGALMLLALTVLTGLLYPFAVTGAARALPGQADGSRVTHDGRVVGSSLLGQEVGPEWFAARPSATDHDGATSGGSNLGMTQPDQRAAVAERREALTRANPDATGPVPADALTMSGSGLDPHISPAYARWQVARVARARGLDEGRVRALVERHVEHPALGFLGQDRVNTVELNLALADLAKG